MRKYLVMLLVVVLMSVPTFGAKSGIYWDEDMNLVIYGEVMENHRNMERALPMEMGVRFLEYSSKRERSVMIDEYGYFVTFDAHLDSKTVAELKKSKNNVMCIDTTTEEVIFIIFRDAKGKDILYHINSNYFVDDEPEYDSTDAYGY